MDEYESVKLLGAVVMEEEIPTLFQEGQGKSRDIDGGCGGWRVAVTAEIPQTHSSPARDVC